MRARKISEEIRTPIYQDFWEPPSHITQKGRINAESEQLLYLADQPITAIQEIRASPTDSFMLMFYVLIENLTLTEIGFINDSHASKVQQFLENLFTTNSSHIYDITNFSQIDTNNTTKDGSTLPWLTRRDLIVAYIQMQYQN